MSSPLPDEELVSVVIPAFNASATIGHTLRSALAQSHRAIEILVVDDGSRDGTPEIVRRFARDDPRVRLMQQANAGVSAARNNGFAAARGACLAPLDADDLWHPEKLARQLRALHAAGPDAGVAYCWSVKIDEAGLVHPTGASAATFAGDVYPMLVLSNFFGNASSPLFRRTAFEAAGGYDPGLRASGADGCEDLKFYLAIAERTRVAVVPEFLVGYRSTPGAMSRKLGNMLRAHALVLGDVRRRHPELPRFLFRWSRANFCAELAGRAVADGRHGRAALLALRALVQDPRCPRLRRSLRNLAARAGRGRVDGAADASSEINLDRLAGRADWPDFDAVRIPALDTLAARRLARLAALPSRRAAPAGPVAYG